jgi:imidazolonepropionase-like amidohydrolase
MNLPKPSAAVLCLIVCARPLLAADSSGPPDMVLFNGKVFTADASHPHVQGLAIRGDRIMETGESVAIRALSGPHTRLIDLGGHTVIPGINDAHQHLFVTPPELIAVQLKSRDPAVVRGPRRNTGCGTKRRPKARDIRDDRTHRA